MEHENYSQAEIKLFTSFGMENLLFINPIALYKMTMEKAFSKNMVGDNVEALRRAIKAIEECKVWRLTPEFDALVSFNKPVTLEEVKFGQKFKIVKGEMINWVKDEKNDIFQKTEWVTGDNSDVVCITSQSSFKTRFIGKDVLKDQYVVVID